MNCSRCLAALLVAALCMCECVCLFFLFAVQFYFHWFPILFFRLCIYRLSAFALNSRRNARLLNSKRLVLFTQQISQNILSEYVPFKSLYLQKNISQITNIKNQKPNAIKKWKDRKHHNLQISVKDWLCLRGAINECSKESNWNLKNVFISDVRKPSNARTQTYTSEQKREVERKKQRKRNRNNRSKFLRKF